MFRSQAVLISAGILGLAEVGSGALVWESTFDSSADGVVNAVNLNTNKEMIGPASGGRLQITSWDITDYTQVDKAGRPLGADLTGGNNSFSGLYKFEWTQLEQTQNQAWEAVGFIGTPYGDFSTRRFMGTTLRHQKFNNDYYVGVDLFAAGWGNTSPFTLSGNNFYLGPNAVGTDYQLAIGYNGATHVLDVALYSASGTEIARTTGDLDIAYPGFATESPSFLFNYLGWSDYNATGDQPTVWSVDSLAYYNDAAGAHNAAAVPEPTAIVSSMIAVGALLRRRRS